MEWSVLVAMTTGGVNHLKEDSRSYGHCRGDYIPAETLYYGDYALSTKPITLIWAHLFPVTRWSCSQQSLVLAGDRLQLLIVAGIRCPDKYHIGFI